MMWIAAVLIALIAAATLFATFPGLWLRRMRAFLDRAARRDKAGAQAAGLRD